MTYTKQEKTDNCYACRVNIDITNPDQAKIDEQGRIHSRIQRNQCKAIIIHPSLGAPLLVEAGKAISFFILGDAALYDLHHHSDERNGNGLEVRQIIGLHIRYQAFDESLDDKTQPVVKGELICTDRASLLENLTYQYLGDIQNLGGRLQNFDKERPFIGLLHPLAQTHYVNLGLHHLFEVTIKGLNLTAGKLYDLSWIGYDRTQEKPLLEWQDSYSQKFLKKDIRIPDAQHYAYNVTPLSFQPNQDQPLENHHPVWVVPTGKPRLNVGHLTDVHISSRQHALRKSRATLIPKASPEIGPQVNASFDTLKDLMNQFGEDPEIDVLIFTGDLVDYSRNYNPAALPQENTGTLWQEMNLDRLNLRDEKGSPVRLENGALHPDTQRYPRGIDNAIMYSLLLWYMKKHKKPIMLTAGNHEMYTLPYGISPRVRFWTALRGIFPGKARPQEEIVEKSKKQRDKEWEKTKKQGVGIYDAHPNEGVPANHNLTIPEATLMYGPDYARVPMGGAYKATGIQNFNPDNLDWFSIFYTPLSDYAMNWGEQCFIVLGWGDTEKFVSLIPDGQGLGFLPRASGALSPDQKQLIEHAIDFKQPCNILCAHFTFANFAQERCFKGDTNPIARRQIRYRKLGNQATWQAAMLKEKQKLQEEADRFDLELRYEGSSENTHSEVIDRYVLVPRGAEGKLYFNQSTNIFGPHDTGTFERNRYYLFNLIGDNKIHYTLSGHSHRAGLYEPVNVYDTEDHASMTVRSHVAMQDAYQYLPKDKPRLIVSACGGPIALQNHEGELFNWGLDRPSGTCIKFDGSQEKEIRLKQSKVHQAMPRLAVALDFADLMCREEHDLGVFSKFESITDDGPFTIEINPKVKLPAVNWIGGMTFYVLQGRARKDYQMTLKRVGNGYSASLDLSASELLNFSKMNEKNTYYISIDLNQVLADQLPTDYDCNTPWTFQLELLSRHQLIKDKYEEQKRHYESGIMLIHLEAQEERELTKTKGFIIQRHSKWGEVPWHWKYSQIDPIEYKYPWEAKAELEDSK